MSPTDLERRTEPATDLEDKPSSLPEEAPDGGLEAWLVAAGGASIFFSALGFANSFGIFEQYYLTHQLHDQSKGNVAWIGSVASFLQFAAGAIGGPLFDRYGAWVSLISSLKQSMCPDSSFNS